jgi:predicted O-methyltransferase YrrM
MVRISGARNVLEIGTLGAYSTIWLARALPQGGQVVTLEIDPHHAEIARKNLERAGVLDRVDITMGPALDTLNALYDGAVEPFDLIFIDADKKSLPEYLDWSLKLSHPGTVIIADNVVRDGKVIDTDSSDADVQGVRRMTELMATNPRLSATAIPTVGARGYDGFAMAVVLS